MKEMLCPNVGSGADSRCVVKVKVDSSNKITVEAETIKFTPGSKQRIIWKLTGNHEFIAARGDGVFIKDDDKDEFADGYPTSDEQGNNKKKREKHFKWDFDNNMPAKYSYRIRFHKDPADPPVECDPFISNQAGDR